MLDAHRVGNIFLQLHRSDFRGQIRNSTDLPNQVALLYALIERFGPNQVVGVPAFGDPLENLSFGRAFFSETLHSCLSLTYILRFILIHKVPESFLPPRHTLPQVIRGGWEQHRYRDWGGLYSNITRRVHPSYGRFLYNGAPYSQRPIQDHRVQQEDGRENQLE